MDSLSVRGIASFVDRQIFERFNGAKQVYFFQYQETQLVVGYFLPQIESRVQIEIDFIEPFVFCMLIRRGFEEATPTSEDRSGVIAKVYLQEALRRLGIDTTYEKTKAKLLYGKYESIPEMICLILDLLGKHQQVLCDNFDSIF